MDETARFARNTLWLGLAQALRFVTSAVLLILIPRALPEVAQYGRLALALSLCGIFAVLADFGLCEITVRDVARDRALAGPYLHGILGLKLLLGAGVYALIALTCALLGYPPETTIVVLLIGGYTVASSFCVSLNHQLRALERMDWEARAVAIQNALIAVCVLAALYLTRRTVAVACGYLVAGVLSCGATLALYRSRGGPLGLRFGWAPWGALLRRAWYFALSNLVLLIYLQIDVVMLRQLTDDTQVGYYQAAARVIAAAAFPALVLLGAAVPMLSRLYEQARERFNTVVTRLTHVLLAMIMPLSAVAWIFSRQVIKVLFRAKYLPAAEMLSLLAVGLLIRYLAPYRTVLSVTGHQRTVFLTSLAAAAVNVGLNLYFIPRYGGRGAAMATVITCSVVTVALAGCCYRRLHLRSLDLSTAIIVTSGALFADGASRLLPYGFAVAVVSYLVAYGAIVLLAAFSPEERRLAWGSLRQLAGLDAAKAAV